MISWGWAFLYAIISDIMIVEGLVIIFSTSITLIVGSAPDACGKFRNCCLDIIPQAIKDGAK
jgi:hypothetical protein